jgi:hypothetical protein
MARKTKCEYVVESDHVPNNWHPEDKPQTVEEWGKREYAQGFEAGSKSRSELAVRVVMDRAKIKFEAGYDGDARALRELANEIAKVCKETGHDDE